MSKGAFRKEWRGIDPLQATLPSFRICGHSILLLIRKSGRSPRDLLRCLVPLHSSSGNCPPVGCHQSNTIWSHPRVSLAQSTPSLWWPLAVQLPVWKGSRFFRLIWLQRGLLPEADKLREHRPILTLTYRPRNSMTLHDAPSPMDNLRSIIKEINRLLFP